jgi:putative ABC transport system ATP-binding protein
MQQALALGVIGFVVGKITATFAAPALSEIRAADATRFGRGLFCRAGDLCAGQSGGHSHGAQGRSGRGDWWLNKMRGKGIRLEGLRKRYGEGDTAVDALEGRGHGGRPRRGGGAGRAVWFGQKHLLKCLGAVIDPTAGRMVLGDEVIYDNGWKVRDLRALRRDKIGFVFQAPYLIPFLGRDRQRRPAADAGRRPNAEARAARRWTCSRRWMCSTAPKPCRRSCPAASSSGWRLPAGLVNRPPVILADEPTAPLDSERAWR